MTCKEVEKWIPLFLRDDLDTDDLREFMEHIDKCEECREELSIQFLDTEMLSWHPLKPFVHTSQCFWYRKVWQGWRQAMYLIYKMS